MVRLKEQKNRKTDNKAFSSVGECGTASSLKLEMFDNHVSVRERTRTNQEINERARLVD